MKEHVVHLEKKSLKRVLGTGDLFSVGYGDVGSSIYYALGATAFYALGATPVALAIAGFVFICTALTYAELSSTFPEPGGSAAFARHAFNDLISFVAGWGLLLDYIVTIAISAFAIPPYLGHVLDVLGFSFTFEQSPAIHLALTVGIILFLLAVNIVGVKQSTRLSFYLAIMTIITQLLIILLGLLFLLNLPLVIEHLRIGVPNADWSPSWGQFFKGIAMAMVAYTGIEAITQLTAETKSPGTIIPRAIKYTVFVLIVLYLGISMVGLSAVSPQDLSTKYLMDPVAGIVMQFPIGGALIAPWVGLLAAILLLIASNAGLIGSSRLTFAMGEYYQVPRLFYRLHSKFRTPYVSLTVFAILACIIVLISRGEMLFLADLYNFGAMIAFASAHLSLIALRIKRPDLKRPYKAPLNIPIGRNRSIPLTAVIGWIATSATWVLVVITKEQGRNLGIIWIALGLAMYVYYRRKKKIAPLGHLAIEKIKIPNYAPLALKNILVLAQSMENESVQLACELAKQHKSKITAIYILEIPTPLPINAPLKEQENLGEAALKRAEAIGRESGLTLELALVRARSSEQAILDQVQHHHHDLLILGAISGEGHFALGSNLEKLVSKSPCRVWFCRS